MSRTIGRVALMLGGLALGFPAAVMRMLRDGIEAALARHLPSARVLYWT